MNTYIFPIINSVIPGFLLFLGKNDYLWRAYYSDWESKLSISEEQFWTFSIGFVWAATILPIQMYLLNKKYTAQNKAHTELITFSKKQFLEWTKAGLGENNEFDAKFRIFIPAGKQYWLFGKHLNLKLVDIPGISDFFHTDLNFSIGPQPEGLVGKAFQSQKSIIDLDVRGKDDYLIPKHLKSKVNDVRFCCAIPLFREKKIYAILGIDSDQPLALNKEEKAHLEESLKRILNFVTKHYNKKQIKS